MSTHPCLRCGACCAHFRVAFHWSETDAHPDGLTPSAATEVLDPHRVVMRGTYAGRIHCHSLRGTVGADAQCGIYPLRPSPCRELYPAWEDGRPSPQCDQARAAYGLEPLSPQHWSASARSVTDRDRPDTNAMTHRSANATD
ncbi:YkgJ family cysteine cluster protein [Lysobacter sp. Hz 25]|uniref:YkgJ family cysteine cluster protein n=1 Tax=Lysobacter sp. Hz 25 TaxID=3383698 RepID=UPI0038D3A56B